MRIKYIDLSNKIPISSEELLTRLIEKAGAYNYVVLASHNTTEVKVVNNITLLPRHVVNSETPLKSEVRGRVLRVLTAKTSKELKLSNRIVKSVDAVEIGNALLTDRRVKKVFTKLVNVGKPVIINASEILDALLAGKDLSNLYVLLSLYEKGSLLLSLGSGARVLEEMHHPSVYYALLQELGLSEAKSLSALTTNPLSVLRSVGFNLTS